MAKSKKRNGKFKQDAIHQQFKHDIFCEDIRDYKTITEQCFNSKKVGVVTEPYEETYSFYQPQNPLIGSCSWSKQQWSEYKNK